MSSEDIARSRLESMLVDENVEPKELPISLLESITNNFSDGQQIGRGGFAVVYQGLLKNGSVAVKRLFDVAGIDDTKFLKEADCLTRVKHKNIVRFLGYCADTRGRILNYQEKLVIGEKRERLLCFEFLPNGSLDKHISYASGGLQWVTRYQIIRGICEGLQYLHQQKIVHLDLNPANILLDHNMVAKIADFGIARCFDKAQSRAVTLNPCGSLGYMAPEYITCGEITLRSDIYSLGVIILEIVAGRKGCPAIDNVLQTWGTRFETSKGGTRLEPIKVCIELGIECTDFNPAKRPDIWRIIERLDEMEQTYRIIVADLCTSSEMWAGSSDSKLVDELQSMSISDEAPSPWKQITSSSAASGVRGEKPGSRLLPFGDAGGKLVRFDFDRPLAITAEELLHATADDRLSTMPYSTMYKATLKNDKLVCVKRLDKMITKGHREFKDGAAMFGMIRHPNLLALRAYYLEPTGDKMLVVDYMHTGCLAAFLFSCRSEKVPVAWTTRMMIAMGIACGLAYLHDDMNIIHGNLTSMNVFLDWQNRPKIAEFELSRLVAADAMSNAQATSRSQGYGAPELTKDTKADVYSLGIIILELLTGKCLFGKLNDMFLPQWVTSIPKEQISMVFDLELMSDAAEGNVRYELMHTLKLALQCVDPSPSARPEAYEVLRQLQQIRPDTHTPFLPYIIIGPLD